MKKIFAIILALILAFSFAGCSNVTADPGDTTTDGTIGSGTNVGDAMENAGNDIGNAMDDMTDGLTDSNRSYESRYGNNNNTLLEYKQFFPLMIKIPYED